VVEIIIPPGIASIMTRAQTTLGCMPLLLILYRPLIPYNHKICSILHIELLYHIYHSHLLSFKNNNLLYKPCTQCLTLHLHHPIL
jgi:hypothetical protein